VTDWWETVGTPDPTTETVERIRRLRRKRKKVPPDPWLHTPTETPREVADGEPPFAPEP
jgi:hypothetical protein